MAFLQNHTSENMTCQLKIVEDHDAILVLKSDFDSSLIYVNALLATTHSALNFLSKNYYLAGAIVFTIMVIYLIYKIYFDPICYLKELTEVGFDHIKGKHRMIQIRRSQALRKQGDKVPPPYPNGWFAVAESRDLKKGGVMAVDALGQNFCVYRGDDGVARIVDAYCPHLGAHLGNGTVSGDCIQCPFHHWTFGGDGACKSQPRVEQVPKGISIRVWRCVEADGAVWVWHDVEGRDPLWSLEDAPECRQWGYRGRNEFVVSAHIQEIPENGADVGHLNVIHATSMISGLGEKFPSLKDIIGHHEWSANWTSNGDHTTSISLSHDYKILGRKFFHTSLKIQQIGPGHVRLLINTPVGPFLLSQSVTPLGPMLQRVTNRLYSPVYNAFASWFIIVGEGKMIERDVQIWNSKRFVASPVYAKTDKTIRAFRNWYSQFYSENSISYKDATQNKLEW